MVLAEWGPHADDTADGAGSLNHGLLLLSLRYGTPRLGRGRRKDCVHLTSITVWIKMARLDIPVLFQILAALIAINFPVHTVLATLHGSGYSHSLLGPACMLYVFKSFGFQLASLNLECLSPTA